MELNAALEKALADGDRAQALVRLQFGFRQCFPRFYAALFTGSGVAAESECVQASQQVQQGQLVFEDIANALSAGFVSREHAFQQRDDEWASLNVRFV